MATPDQKPQATVFYSWQSDLPNATNRGLIHDALGRAAKRISTDDSVSVEPVIDRDTQNVPGAPDIAHTIFQKIEKAAAFVADVSIINTGLGRPTPNPNVLIELGFALKALGNARTVLVANTAFGSVESLPFDLRTKRVLTYHLPSSSDGKPEQRTKLQEGLEAALRAILADTASLQVSASPSTADKIVQRIEEGATGQGALCTRFMNELAERVRELTPKLDRAKPEEFDDQLVKAIQETLPLVTDFARIADVAAIHDSSEAAHGLFRGFPPLFVQYDLMPGTSGGFYRVQFDLPKFVGHELMVTLFAALLRDRRWKSISELCRETITIPDPNRRPGASAAVTFLFASESVELLDHRSQRLKLNRVCLHADLLKERHESGRLGELSPWRQFQEADTFLYLRSALTQEKFDIWSIWRPWSAAFLSGCPAFLIEATQKEKATQLLEPLGVPNLAELRSRLKERARAGLHSLFASRNPFFDAFGGLNPELIGTR